MVFPECSLLPHAGTITLCRMQKQAGSRQGAVCFSPISWQGASQPKHTPISRRSLGLSALFALLPAAGQAASLFLAPSTQPWEAPGIVTSPTQASTVVLLRALWCSCRFPAWERGQYKLFLLSARMPRAHTAQPGWVSTLAGLYALTAGGTRAISQLKVILTLPAWFSVTASPTACAGTVAKEA